MDDVTRGEELARGCPAAALPWSPTCITATVLFRLPVWCATTVTIVHHNNTCAVLSTCMLPYNNGHEGASQDLCYFLLPVCLCATRNIDVCTYWLFLILLILSTLRKLQLDNSTRAQSIQITCYSLAVLSGSATFYNS